MRNGSRDAVRGKRGGDGEVGDGLKVGEARPRLRGPFCFVTRESLVALGTWPFRGPHPPAHGGGPGTPLRHRPGNAPTAPRAEGSMAATQ